MLIYDQTCAAEKRRRRKRGTFPDPDKRVIINELVCEGCGDCGVKSNCVSVQPLETEFGRKRSIDQSSCNKDLFLRQGLLPVLRHRAWREAQARPRASAGERRPAGAAGAGTCRSIGAPYGIIVTGVGGTGVVTIGAHARHGGASRRQGRAASSTWPASRRRAARSSAICASPTSRSDIHAIRIAAGGADLVLGCDIVVAGNKKVLAAVKHGATRIVVNTAEVMPGDFTRNADFSLPTERLQARDRRRPRASDRAHFVDATRLATALFGNSIAANMFMLGYAYQHGALPLSAEAIEQAIELNGEAVAMNSRPSAGAAAPRSTWRRVEAMVRPAAGAPDDNRQLSQTFDETVERRAAFLTAYQNAAYAQRYRAHGRRALAKPKPADAPGKCGLAEAVARYLFKLMAYKDEYEVARLYTDGSFEKQVAAELRRREPALRIPSRAAAPGLAQGCQRRAAQDDVRAVDDDGVPAAGAAEIPARHAVRSLRLHRRAADRAPA